MADPKFDYDPEWKPEAPKSDGPSFDYNPAWKPAPKPSPLRRVADIPVALAKGVVGAGEAAVGLADLATGGQAGKALHDATGYDPKATKEFLDEQYSPQQKEAKAKVDQATGFVGKAKAMLENPSTIGEAVVESAPLMLGGGAVAQGLGKATKLGAVARSALGEGIVGAGSAAEGIRQETPDGTLDGKQSLAALGTGAGTAAITAASGGIARRLGISDLDTQLATRGGVAEGLANTSTKGRARRLGEGALAEGVLEEMPQSGLEQGLQNVALDKPIGEGVPEAMAAGMLTGAAMGGPLSAAPATAKARKQPEQSAAAEDPPAETAAAPAPAPAPILDAEAMQRAGVMPPPVLDDEQIRRQVDLESGAPIPFTTAPAEELAAQRKAAMGIDPAAGPLSAGAAIAVETQAAEEVRLGAAAMLAEGAARAQQAQAERAAWEAANPGIPYEPVTEPLASNKPAPAPSQGPSGSFGAINDFAELLSQERQDVAQRRAGIAERQGLRRDFDLAEADRRTAESMQREAQARRRAVLDAVLADPETKNPAGRFAATLRREGYRDSTPTEDELQTIQRFEDVRAAKPAPPEVEPSAPNELDPAAMGIRERRAPAPPKNLREGMARAQAARAAEGGSMPQAAQSTAAPSFDPGKAWASLSTQQRADLAGRLQGVPPIVSKNVPRAEWGKINPALRAKLAEAMQAPSTAVQAPSITAAAPNIPQENPNGTTRPDTAGVAAGRDPQGSVDARGVVDYGADGGGRAAGAVQRNAAAEPAAGVPGAGDRPVPAKVRKGRGGVLIEDERLARHADSLEFMAEDAGWQEVGGRLVRDAAGNAAGRTKWLPRAPWFQAGMQGDPQALAESVRKAASGQPIPSRDMRTIQAMMDWLDAQENGGTLDEDSSAAEWERIGYNEASPEEQAAFDAIDIFLDSVAINEIDAMRALGFTEDEIRAEIEAAERKGRPGEAVAGGAQERAQDDREGARDEAPAVLESYSEKDLADRAEAQRLSDERKANEERRLEEKAQADAARDTFTLTGSDRPADVLATQGQGGLFDQQAPAANQNPIKTETRAKTEAAAGPASANQETPVIGRMVSRLGETPSQQYRNSFGPSGETQAWEPREFTMRRSDWDALQKVASGRSGTKNGTKLTIELEDVEDRVRDALTVQSLHQTVTSMKVAVSRLRTVWDQAASQARQEAEAPASATPSVGEAPSQLEALFSDLNSTSTRKANKARKAAAKLPEAARIEYVQANFHDLLIQLMDSGSLEVNGTTTLTEDNASCL